MELVLYQPPGDAAAKQSLMLDSQAAEQGLQLHLRWSADRLQSLLPDLLVHESLDQPGEIRLWLTKPADNWQVAFAIELTENRLCIRCGERFVRRVEHSGNRTISPESQVAWVGHEGTNLTDSFIFAGDEILLDELLIDLLADCSDSYPVCRENCAGICAHCGTNLNQKSCSCEPVRISPLAQALAAGLQTD